jgi:hypothetical protein
MQRLECPHDFVAALLVRRQKLYLPLGEDAVFGRGTSRPRPRTSVEWAKPAEGVLVDPVPEPVADIRVTADVIMSPGMASPILSDGRRTRTAGG